MRLAFLASLILSVWFAVPASAQNVCSPMVLSSIVINENTAGYTISLNYPVLCQFAASRVIRDYVTRDLSEFKLQFPEHDLTDYRHKHEMLSEYAVWPAGQGRFASIKLQIMIYTGGAHPNNWPVTWTFDMTDGRVVTLDDVFVDAKEALRTIAPMVRDVLRASLGQMALPSMLEPGTVPSKDNYEDFILNDEGIAFFFAPYQVAPYAAGQQVVTIPWEQVDALLKSDMRNALRR